MSCAALAFGPIRLRYRTFFLAPIKILTDPGLHSLHMYVTWEVTCLAGSACRARHRNFIDM
jgi:hypothetical protein